MLRLADELLLFLIDPRRGGLIPIPARSLAGALAGALLMDLALDPVLAEIARAEAARSARFWVAHVAGRGDEIRDQTLARLTAHGILEADEDGHLAFVSRVTHTRLYPLPDQAGREDVRLRVMRVLFSDDVPDPRDVVIIGLADACGAFDRLLSPGELVVAQERLARLGRMDPIVRAVAEVVRRDRPSPPGAVGV